MGQPVLVVVNHQPVQTLPKLRLFVQLKTKITGERPLKLRKPKQALGLAQDYQGGGAAAHCSRKDCSSVKAPRCHKVAQSQVDEYKLLRRKD